MTEGVQNRPEKINYNIRFKRIKGNGQDQAFPKTGSNLNHPGPLSHHPPKKPSWTHSHVTESCTTLAALVKPVTIYEKVFMSLCYKLLVCFAHHD